MTEHVLNLSTVQLYEVYSAMWREFVSLHKEATANPHGLHKAVIERVRLSRTAAGQVCDMIEAMRPEFATTDERYIEARSQALIEAEHGVIFASTRHGASFVMAEFPNDGKPYDLSKIAPFAYPVPPSFTSRPDNEVFEVVELAAGLHGKDFAMLTEDELKRFQLLRKIGRKFGLIVSVELLNEDKDLQAELAAASPEQQEQIYRRHETKVLVQWFAMDSDQSKSLGHTIITGGEAGAEPFSHKAFKLNGRAFSDLDSLEVNLFRTLRAAGSKLGIVVSVDVINDDENIQAELAAASPEQQEDIFRRLKTEIAVRWAVSPQPGPYGRWY